MLRNLSFRRRALPPLLVACLCLLLPLPALAQPAAAAPEMADALRQDGKFWVVVGVIAIVTAGVLVFLFRLDGKVRRLEERVGRRA